MLVLGGASQLAPAFQKRRSGRLVFPNQRVATEVFVDSAVCVRTGDEVVQGWQGQQNLRGYMKEGPVKQEVL